MQPDLFEHFHSEKHNGFLQNCSFSSTNKTDDSEPTRLEGYWRAGLRTVTSYGLNRTE